MRTLAVLSLSLALSACASTPSDDTPQSIVQQLVNDGVFDKVERPGTNPWAWVTPRFYSMSFEQRTLAVAAVHAMYFPDGGDFLDTVSLKDRDGRTCGTYTTTAGLAMSN